MSFDQSFESVELLLHESHDCHVEAVLVVGDFCANYTYEEVVKRFEPLDNSFVKTLRPREANALAKLEKSHRGVFVFVGGLCSRNQDSFDEVENAKDLFQHINNGK